jgi:hypothetical protein
MPIDVGHLYKGKKYEITYQLGTQRYPRKGVALYLGLNQNYHDLDFSGRPKFGTTSIPIENILIMKMVQDNAQCFMNARA